jgi:hypothetical protein
MSSQSHSCRAARGETKPQGLGKKMRWLKAIFTASNDDIINNCGLDAFFFLRYLWMLIRIFLPLTLLLIPVLTPMNKIDGKDTNYYNGQQGLTQWNVTGLDQLAWGNIRPRNHHRYWIHLTMSIVVVLRVCSVICTEWKGFIRIRQAHLFSPLHQKEPSARTILVRSLPQSTDSEKEQIQGLRTVFNHFPGGVRHIWMNRDYKILAEKIEKRNKLSRNLEAALTRLIIQYAKALKIQMQHHTTEEPLRCVRTENATELCLSGQQGPVNQVYSGEEPMENKDPEVIVKREKVRVPRHTWTPGWLYVVKRDAISFYRDEICQLNADIRRIQQNQDDLPLANSAFIQFERQEAAHMACQTVIHPHPTQMALRDVEVSANDVIWENISSQNNI